MHTKKLPPFDATPIRTGVCSSIRKFVISEEGPTAVEYAVMLALIITMCFVAISNVGTANSAKWTDNNNKLNSAGFNQSH